VLDTFDERVRRIVREELSSRMPARPAVEEEMTVKEVAAIKGVRPKTVYEWKAKGCLNPTRRRRAGSGSTEGTLRELTSRASRLRL
jgi:hypothetical protein